MVGLPYPNIRSPELKEKMQYLNMHMVRDYLSRLCSCKLNVIGQLKISDDNFVAEKRVF